MNKYSGYIALLVVFFVVFLGMRNPWLDNTSGPKRKGRAVVSSNSFSKNLSVSYDKYYKDHDTTTPVALLLTTKITGASPFMASSPAVSEQTLLSPLYLSIRSSRAPPTSIS